MNNLFRKVITNKAKHNELERLLSTNMSEGERFELNKMLDELDIELAQLEKWGNIIKSLDELNECFNVLEESFEEVDEEILNNFIEKGYPFEKDFFSMVNDVRTWVDVSIGKIREQE